MFQCRVSALSFVVGLPAPRVPERTCAPGYGSVRLVSVDHYPNATARIAISIPDLCQAGMLLWSQCEESVRISNTTSQGGIGLTIYQSWRKMTICSNSDSILSDFLVFSCVPS